MSFNDRLMLKMMSNKVVIKIFSIPIVVKLINFELKVFMGIASLFKGKEKAEA